MNSPEGSDDRNTKMMKYLQETAGIAQGVLNHRMDLPWKHIPDDDYLSDLVGDHLISYLVECLDIKTLFGQDDLYDLVRPLLGYYFPMADLESIEADIEDPRSEIIYTKTDLNDYMIVSKILNYPTLLIQKFETMYITAPGSYEEAENMRQQILNARNKALVILDKLYSGE